MKPLRQFNYVIAIPNSDETTVLVSTKSPSDIRKLGHKVIGMQTEVDATLVRNHPVRPKCAPDLTQKQEDAT